MVLMHKKNYKLPYLDEKFNLLAYSDDGSIFFVELDFELYYAALIGI